MPQKTYLLTLTDEEREQLEPLLHSGTHATRKVTRARILLKAAEGWEDRAIAAALSVGRATVERLRQRCVEEGRGAREERPRPGTHPKLAEKAAARLIAEAWRGAPEGRKRWTLPLLAARVVARGLAESYSYESVRRVVKKVPASRGGRSHGAPQRAVPSVSPPGKTSWRSPRSRMSRDVLRSTWRKRASNGSQRPDCRGQRREDSHSAWMTSTNAMAPGISFSVSNRRLAGDTCR
jgi:transposase